MRRETIAIHSGHDIDPTTRAVAVPIHQTVAYAFDSTEHAAALFNLEADVVPQMIRLIIGIEHSEDIIADLKHALDASTPLATTKGDPDARLV